MSCETKQSCATCAYFCETKGPYEGICSYSRLPEAFRTHGMAPRTYSESGTCCLCYEQEGPAIKAAREERIERLKKNGTQSGSRQAELRRMVREMHATENYWSSANTTVLRTWIQQKRGYTRSQEVTIRLKYDRWKWDQTATQKRDRCTACRGPLMGPSKVCTNKQCTAYNVINDWSMK